MTLAAQPILLTPAPDDLRHHARRDAARLGIVGQRLQRDHRAAAIGTLVPRDGHVLVPNNGAYCQRIAKICRVLGRKLTTIDYREDRRVDPADVERARRQSDHHARRARALRNDFIKENTMTLAAQPILLTPAPDDLRHHARRDAARLGIDGTATSTRSPRGCANACCRSCTAKHARMRPAASSRSAAIGTLVPRDGHDARAEQRRVLPAHREDLPRARPQADDDRLPRGSPRRSGRRRRALAANPTITHVALVH